MTTMMDMQFEVDALCDYMGLNDTIRKDLHDAEEFTIANDKKQGHLLSVLGVRKDGTEFKHRVMWRPSR